jgi:hypothetical protein
MIWANPDRSSISLLYRLQEVSICAGSGAGIEGCASYRREGKSAPVEKTGIFSLSLPFGNVEAQALDTGKIHESARTADF